MRIRKNQKLSSMSLLSHGTCPDALQTHVCQLNQSPWDVINFSPDTFLPSSKQFNGEDDGFNGNGSFESMVMSMEVKMEEEEEEEEEEDDNGKVDSNDNFVVDGLLKGGSRLKSCVKRDQHCKNKERNKVEGQPSSRNKNNNHSMHDTEDNQINNGFARASNTRRGGRPRKTGSSKGNSIQFYYYSGFGPSWGKKRSERGGGGAGTGGGGLEEEESLRQNAPSSSNYDNGEIDYVDSEEEYDDEDGGGDSDKKRMRKPVKARSLKSLM